MGNPATLLAEMLAQWDVPGGYTAERQRGDLNALSVEFWKKHAHAVELLREVEREISALEAIGRNVTSLRAAVPHWYRAVFAVSTPWGTNNQVVRRVIDPRDLAQLQVLGQWIDDREAAPAMLADEIEAISNSLVEATSLVNESDTLPAVSKGYLLALINEAQTYLSSIEEYGTVQVRKVTFELSGAMFSCAASFQEQEEQRRWGAAAWGIMGRVGGVAGLAAIGGVAGEVAKTIVS
ncbi:hypothetical protein [Spirillospora sp. NPDC048823]|uniref:hypothetical protein n=1 Tax=unclassified Spirillospora TaxID=2642701 RepID=UPI00371C4FA8